MIIILFATQLYIYKGSYVNTRPFIILLILLRRIILYISQKISSYLDQSSTAENGDIYCRKRVPISNILLSLYPYRSENVLLCPLIWINHQLQKMGTYTAEKGYLYQIYFYRYIFISRKMSLYKSETISL